MNDYKGYKIATIGDIPMGKLRKAAKSGKISFTASELKGNRRMLVHPSNYSKIKKAQAKGSGIQGMQLSGPEIMTDIEYHDSMGGSMHGGSVWSWVKNAAKDVGSWLQKSGVGTVLADAAAAAAVPFLGQTGSQVARDVVRNVAGVGLADRMAKARAAKKGKKPLGGSFLIN